MIFRLLIGIVAVYIFYKLVRWWLALGVSQKTNLPAVGEDLVEDPFCHTYIPMSNALQLELEGKKVYFCSRECLEKYKEQKGV